MSLGKVGISPSAFAGHPSRTRPDSVLSVPLASGWKEPVVVSNIVVSETPVDRLAPVVTGSIPRPEIAMSIALDVPTSAPRWLIMRDEVARTPPAEYLPAP